MFFNRVLRLQPLKSQKLFSPSHAPHRGGLSAGSANLYSSTALNSLLAFALAACGGGGGGGSSEGGGESRIGGDVGDGGGGGGDAGDDGEGGGGGNSPTNQKPSTFRLSAEEVTLTENADTDAHKLANIEVTDDGLGTYEPRLTVNTNIFEIRKVGDGYALYLKVGVLDFETEQTHTATIELTATGAGETLPPVKFALRVGRPDGDNPPPSPPPGRRNVEGNKKPTAMSLSETAETVFENIDTNNGYLLADIEVIDDGLGTFSFELTAGGEIFEIRKVGNGNNGVGNGNNGAGNGNNGAGNGNNNDWQLWLRAGAVLDYEAAQTHTATISLKASGTGETPADVTFTLTVDDVDEAPTAFSLSEADVTLSENTDTTNGYMLSEITITDADTNPQFFQNTVNIAASDIFEIKNGNELWLKAGAVLDYEAAQTHTATISLTASGTGETPADVTFTLMVDDVDEAPTAFSLSEADVTLSENTDTTNGHKLAEITITDADTNPQFLQNTFSIAASDIFEIKNGNELWLKAGAVLDYEAAQTHTATITLTASGTGNPPAPVTFELTVRDVDELPTAFSLSDAEVTLSENTDTTNGHKLAEITFTDVDTNPQFLQNTVSIAASDVFEIKNGNELWLKAGAVLDYSTAQRHQITLTGSGGHTAVFALMLTVSQPPTEVQLNTDILHISPAEDIPPGNNGGIEVGTLTATDPDDISGFTYRVLVGSKFIARDGKLYFVGTSFNAPGEAYTVSVLATDSGGKEQAVATVLDLRQADLIDWSDEESARSIDLTVNAEQTPGISYIGTRFADTFTINQFIDTLEGGPGGDTITDQSIANFPGNDRYDMAANTQYYFNPHARAAHISYAGSGEAVGVTLDLPSGNGFIRQNVRWGGGDAETDKLSTDVRNLIGSAHDDVLHGNEFANYLEGGGGGDDIFVLTLDDDARAADKVNDFGRGNNKIRVDTTDGNEATIEALQAAADITWSVVGRNTEIRYDSDGSNELVMTLSGFTDPLDITHFEVV